MTDPVIAALMRLLERKPGNELHRKQLYARCYGASLRRLHQMAVKD